MRYSKLQAFYHSRKWEEFVKLLRIQRAVNGVVICEECGQPILKPYDCIAHHDTELTEENVDDVSIALNPANIKLVHFKCHNKLHHRFGYAQRRHKTVYLVYGAPCSGKTTYVADVAEPADLILDIDKLWAAIRADKCGEYDKPNELKNVVFSIRDNILDTIRTRYGKWDNAYIIGGYPLIGERERLIDSIGIDKDIFIDTPKDVCLERAKLKGGDWCEFVKNWYEKFTP